jgi:hypothetical protein
MIKIHGFFYWRTWQQRTPLHKHKKDHYITLDKSIWLGGFFLISKMLNYLTLVILTCELWTIWLVKLLPFFLDYYQKQIFM